LPITTDGALRDDAVALNAGFIHSTGVDETGRSVFLFVASNIETCEASRESKVRALWHTIHSALVENETSQKKGVVFIANLRDSQLKRVDLSLIKTMMESLRGSLPLRLSAIHICRPPAFFSMILPIMKMFLGPVLRERIKFHMGSPSKVSASLGRCGVSESAIPVDLGGQRKILC
jgi:CRAL/TRIO domain